MVRNLSIWYHWLWSPIGRRIDIDLLFKCHNCYLKCIWFKKILHALVKVNETSSVSVCYNNNLFHTRVPNREIAPLSANNCCNRQHWYWLAFVTDVVLGPLTMNSFSFAHQWAENDQFLGHLSIWNRVCASRNLTPLTWVRSGKFYAVQLP